MADDKYEDWMAGFRREVDESLASAVPPVPPAEPGREAPPGSEAISAMSKVVGEFEDWWKQETSDLGAAPEPVTESEQVDKELDLSRREVRALRGELERLRADPETTARQSADQGRRRLAEERGSLAARNAELETDNAALRRRETEVLERFSELKVESGRARDAYEERLARLEAALRGAEERVKALSDDRAFLQTEFTRQAGRLDAAERELAEARRREQSLGESHRSATDRLEAEQARCAELERRAAALHGELEALRAQSAALQERLVRAAAPDAGERARSGFDELKRREAALTDAFDARQKKLEDRLREATLWLETKLREAGGTA
ncbi:MAG: hypothetical protein HY928_11245 [Elusimicrobia bacterium]|nr:hypothetical protein [Elusimicrobiota bacterium]